MSRKQPVVGLVVPHRPVSSLRHHGVFCQKHKRAVTTPQTSSNCPHGQLIIANHKSMIRSSRGCTRSWMTFRWHAFHIHFNLSTFIDSETWIFVYPYHEECWYINSFSMKLDVHSTQMIEWWASKYPCQVKGSLRVMERKALIHRHLHLHHRCQEISLHVWLWKTITIVEVLPIYC